MEDQRLLREYVAHNSDQAFTELVRLHLGLVYSVALRRVADPHGAEEVTQAVFTLLAQKARTLGPQVILAGWLYQTACFKAAQHQRAESRRLKREQQAAAMIQQDAPSQPTADWTRMEPLLDDAMQAISDTDRAAILLRFFQQKRLREVGLALSLDEDAARKRVDRALDKLRAWFAARGVAYPAASIAALLSAHAASAAPPAMLATTVSATALKAAAGVTGTAAKLLPILVAMKMKHLLIAASILLVGATVTIYRLAPTHEPQPAPTQDPVAPAPASASEQAPVARIFQALRQGRETEVSADDALRIALARFKEALHAPPKPDTQKIDPAQDLLYAIPVEQRVAALGMVLEALRDGNKHVCLRAIRLVPLIWPQGEAALPILFDLIRSKSDEWPEVASSAMIAAAQARPNPDIVPEMVSAVMQGPRSAHRALAAIFPLVKSFLPGSEAAFTRSLQPYLYSPDPAWRSTAARALAQLPGPKDPSVLRELTAALAPLPDGTPVELAHFGPSLEALMKMGPNAADALPAVQDFAHRNPQWIDHVNLVIKAIASEELHGVGVVTPLPPLDPAAAAVARQIEDGTMTIPQLAAVVENPKTALIGARALAEFGPSASEALPSLRRAFDAAVKTDLSIAFVLGAAIERLDPASPKPLLSATEIVPALQAVQSEAERANVPAWNHALQTLPNRVPLKTGFTHQDVRLLAADLRQINPRLETAFIHKILEADARFRPIFEDQP
jgi:RNA polymerase sigma factor (sigma-70 family)